GHAVDERVAHAVAHEHVDGRVVAQRLLDGERHQVGLLLQAPEQVGHGCHGVAEVPDQVAGGLVARDHQEEHLRAHLDVREAMAELMLLRTWPWRGSGISEMGCSSGGTTTPGSRNDDTKVSTSRTAASTSSWRARYQPPWAVGLTGHVRRASAKSSWAMTDG